MELLKIRDPIKLYIILLFPLKEIILFDWQYIGYHYLKCINLRVYFILQFSWILAFSAKYNLHRI